MRRLLGSLPCLMDLDTRHRSRSVVLQFVCRERGDSSFLIGSDLIRECTGVKMKADNVHLLVDGVRAVVSDRFYNKAVFLGMRYAPVIRRDSRIVGAGHHEKKATVRVEDVDTLRIVPVAVFEQLSGKSLLTHSYSMWGAGIKAQWRRKQLKRG